MSEASKGTIDLTALARTWLSGGTQGASYDLNAPLRPYQQSLWVYRCVTEIQRTCAGIPLRLSTQSDGLKVHTRSMQAEIRRAPGRTLRPVPGRKGVCVGKLAEGEIVESGDAYDLIERPNSYQSWPQLVQSIVGHLVLKGSAALILADLAGARPRELHAVDGSRIAPQLARREDGLLELVGYQYTVPRTGKKIPLAPDECIYWPLWTDGDNPLEGLAPGVPGRLAIATDYNASLFNASVLNNGAVVGLHVSFPQTLSPEQREQFRAALRQRHSGAANAGKELITEGGADAKDLGASMHDLQFNEGKKTTRLELCCLFGVPPVVAGWVDAAGDSSAYTQNALQQFYQQTVFPLLDFLLPGIQAVVARFDGRLVAWWDVEDQPVVQQMRIARVGTAKDLFGMGVPMRDVNNLLDLALPEQPWYETGFLPAGLLPAGDIVSGSQFPAIPEGPSAPGNDDLDQSGEGARSAGSRPGEPGRAGSPHFSEAREAPEGPEETEGPLGQAGERLWKAWMASWQPLAKAVAQILRVRYLAQQRRVIAALKRELPAGGSRSAEAGRAGSPRFTEGRKQDDAIVLRVLLEVSSDRKAWRVKVNGFVTDAAELGLRQAFAEAGLAAEAIEQPVTNLLANPQIVKELRDEAVRISTLIDGATRRVLRTSLVEGVEAGETVRTLADRVQSVMGNSRSHAMVVARNTIGQTLSRSRLQGQKAAGLTHKAWVHSRGPGERRANHIAAEARYAGAPIPIDEPFIIHGDRGEVRLMYPRDFSTGHPEECVNCQCLHIAKLGPAGTTPKALPERFYTHGDMVRDRGSDYGEA